MLIDEDEDVSCELQKKAMEESDLVL